MMTEQEVFDRVARHLLTQKEVSHDDDGCVYRGPRGLKCAVGALIPDEQYDPSFETRDVSTLLLGDHLKFLAHVDISLLCELQMVHDNDLPETWRESLRFLADAHDLSSAVLDEFGEAP